MTDRCSVLRKGKYIGTVDVKTTSVEEMARMMVGRDVTFFIERDDAIPGEPILEVKDICHHNEVLKEDDLFDVSFDVKSGEIVVIAGIDGNGQTELARVITGLDPAKSGSIMLNGVIIQILSIVKRHHGSMPQT